MDIHALIGLNHYITKNGIIIIQLPTSQKSYESASEILIKYSDYKTALFLSADSSYKKLYELLVKDDKFIAGSVGQTDEVFGGRKHRNSKELFISNTGLIDYFANKNIRFYPILETGDSSEEIAKNYDEAIRFILKYFPKSIGVLGIGTSGEIAGIPGISQKEFLKQKQEKIEFKKHEIHDVVNRILDDQSTLISSYKLETYGERVTMNFAAIGALDLILVLALGQEKREALLRMFKEGDIEDCPARFYLRPEIAKKTILITDQVVS